MGRIEVCFKPHLAPGPGFRLPALKDCYYSQLLKILAVIFSNFVTTLLLLCYYFVTVERTLEFALDVLCVSKIMRHILKKTLILHNLLIQLFLALHNWSML